MTEKNGEFSQQDIVQAKEKQTQEGLEKATEDLKILSEQLSSMPEEERQSKEQWNKTLAVISKIDDSINTYLKTKAKKPEQFSGFNLPDLNEEKLIQIESMISTIFRLSNLRQILPYHGEAYYSKAHSPINTVNTNDGDSDETIAGIYHRGASDDNGDTIKKAEVAIMRFFRKHAEFIVPAEPTKKLESIENERLEKEQARENAEIKDKYKKVLADFEDFITKVKSLDIEEKFAQSLQEVFDEAVERYKSFELHSSSSGKEKLDNAKANLSLLYLYITVEFDRCFKELEQGYPSPTYRRDIDRLINELCQKVGIEIICPKYGESLDALPLNHVRAIYAELGPSLDLRGHVSKTYLRGYKNLNNPTKPVMRQAEIIVFK